MCPQEEVAAALRPEVPLSDCGRLLVDAFGKEHVAFATKPALTFHVLVGSSRVTVCSPRVMQADPDDIIVGDKIVGIMREEYKGA